MKIVDLTYDIEEGMLTFHAPWHPKVTIKQMGRIEVEGRETREVTFGTHTGTHIDAPLHFLKGSKSIERIPLSQLIGPVTIVDFSFMKEYENVTAQMLKGITLTERMVFKFGWGKYWGNKEKFYYSYPAFTEDAARLFVEKGVRVLGMDTPSPDDSRTKMGTSEDSKIHKILLKAEIVLLEYLANLNDLTDYKDWNISIMPLRLKGADGAPARVCLYKD